MRKAVFLGDCNADVIMDGLDAEPAVDREVGAASFDVVMGASSCITAAAYAALGGQAWPCGLRGDDEMGRLMVDLLRAAGARTDYVRAAASEKTGVTVNLVRGTGRYQVTYPGAMGVFSPADIPDAVFDGLGHLHVSGIYQLGALLPGVAGILERAEAAGATTSLDCQWDPREEWEGLEAWLPRVSWLFVNAQEALSMTRREGATDPRGALRALARRTRCPVVKAGGAGSLALVEGELVQAPAAAVTVVDTIGAGDNFDAGFLFASIEKEMPLRDALRFANAAGGLSCTFRGGTGARSTWRDVQRFMETHA